MKILICGGRDFTNTIGAFQWLDSLKAKHEVSVNSVLIDPITEVISGMARGADMIGFQWAKNHKIKVTECPADWKEYGKSAGYKRNQQMINLKPDMVIAFKGGKGTQHTIDLAIKAGIQVLHPEVESTSQKVRQDLGWE